MIGTKWLVTMKPSFQTAWLALPPKETRQILEKIALLTADPLPDSKVKKQLKYLDGKLHRMRSGDYRIFYTFQQPYISLLSLVRRSEDTYDEDQDAEFLGGLDIEFPGTTRTVQPDWERLFAQRPPQKRALPEPITQELLVRLHIPEEYHARLLLIHTQEDLLDCPGVPDEMLLQLDEVMFERPLVQVLQQPDYLLREVDDLERFKDGELLSFLLKLSPEQEKAARWAKLATGPTRVKGNPGTGKSIVALYRVRSLIENLLKMGEVEPHILYATYTNALTKSSTQLLEQLLGDNMHYVEVTTADKLIVSLVGTRRREDKRQLHIAEQSTLIGAMKRALLVYHSKVELFQAKHIESLSEEYMLEEICQIIIARTIKTREEYTNIKTTGRPKLSSAQAEAIWNIYELFLQQLEVAHKDTWQQVRLEAERIFQERKDFTRKYDGVIIDEAQDLDPSVIRLMIEMCTAINRFFVTADANQSIYRKGFNWTEIHDSLSFLGRRTTILSTNYRSTRQISEAAQSYLSNGALENEKTESTYMYSGPLPFVRKVQSDEEEFNLLANFLPTMARESRVLLGSCAVLCPTKVEGYRIAGALMQRGVQAQFMSREQIDLKFQGVKILTLHSSKGLEFPIVALAGFRGSRYDAISALSDDERDEVLEKSKRILFVGMTRAMRTLLLIVPAKTASPLLSVFDTNYWNIFS